jgi:outer membrane lipoprotein SlyB
VLGGVVGHQFGGGRGKDAMTVVGAVGGAVAGHQIEKQARAKVVYRVDVRMEDGSLRSITQSTAPTFPVGAKVRVNGNQLVARG